MKYLLEQLSPDMQLLLGKGIGAFVGSMISLAYVLPKGKREAAIRFLTGVSAGLIFGMPIGIWISNKAGITEQLHIAEIAVMGAAISSLCIWTALGVGMHMATNHRDRLAAALDDIDPKTEKTELPK